MNLPAKLENLFENLLNEALNMKNSTRLLMLAIGFVVSTSVMAAAQDETTESPEMPMMKQGGNMMMNPEMMQQMMRQMPQMGHGQ
ncbi:MAG: hypothetical protein KJN95_08975, partial [Gammaproteobacteria bacterium]|nr:hypothetical protein [Gammaproteobacteria bacterium]